MYGSRVIIFQKSTASKKYYDKLVTSFITDVIHILKAFYYYKQILSQWTVISSLVAVNSTAIGDFGSSLSLYNTKIFVGAKADSTITSNGGLYMDYS
jgi:hypothetical protein